VRLRYTLPALADLDAILDYIAARSPQGAKRVQARIQAIIDLLLLHPHIGTRTDNPAIRRLATPPYPYLIFTRPRRPRSLFTPCAIRPATLPGCRARLKSRKSPWLADCLHVACDKAPFTVKPKHIKFAPMRSLVTASPGEQLSENR
jgi:toxin ParE1/3/4